MAGIKKTILNSKNNTPSILPRSLSFSIGLFYVFVILPAIAQATAIAGFTR
jgi:hypothetical protein